MTDRVPHTAPHHRDWASGFRALIIWGTPSAVLLISAPFATRYLVIVWPVLLTLMGVACLLNARQCGRRHCYWTGPFFLLLALVSLLHGAELISLGSKGWWLLSVVFVIGGSSLIYIPEWLAGKYAGSRAAEGCS